MDLSALSDVASNVIAAGLAFAAGFLANKTVHYLRTRRGRRFWGPEITRGDTLLFLGAFPPRDKRFEPTGLVGLGDTRAIHELTGALGDLGIKFRIAYSNRLIDKQLQNNLILVGAEDVNPVAADVLRRSRSSFVFQAEPTLTLRDTLSGEIYLPTWDREDVGPPAPSGTEPDERDHRQLVSDYGIIIRTRSPFDRRRTIVLLAGVYGFATAAAVSLLQMDEFLERCKDAMPNFECSFRVDLIQEIEAKITVLVLRSLPAPTS